MRPEIHELCLQLKDQSLMRSLAALFLGVDYAAWPDGTDLESLDDFKYDFNKLDCVTFVETVLSLAKTEPVSDYKEFTENVENTLKKIRYKNSKTCFVERNHFFSIDWIANNKAFVEDITKSLTDSVKIAETEINRRGWVLKHKINDGKQLPEHIQEKLQIETSALPYIELGEVINNYDDFKKKLPSHAIVNIVRPNWNLKEKIGTNLNISHLGFVFYEQRTNKLSFYHASDVKLEVVKVELIDYLKKYQHSETIKGINVLSIKPGYLDAG